MFKMRLDPDSKQRLEAIAAFLETSQSQAIRESLKVMANQVAAIQQARRVGGIS